MSLFLQQIVVELNQLLVVSNQLKRDSVKEKSILMDKVTPTQTSNKTEILKSNLVVCG